MSGMDSRSPRGDWVWSTKMALPPRVLMAASKVRRVRSEAFSKKRTIWLRVERVAEVVGVVLDRVGELHDGGHLLRR